MELSRRVKQIKDSATLEFNARAVALAESGKNIFNLTAGQLPLRPMSEFVERIRCELDFLKSFQYSPVAGHTQLRNKIIEYFISRRALGAHALENKTLDCVISNGAKHALTNVLGSLIDPGDEVIMMAPYWVSYPEMIKLFGGVPKVVKTSFCDLFVPSLHEIRALISDQTKVILLNSPNNPTGRHYPHLWMKDFAQLMLDFPQVCLISDEIYYELSYYDPGPTYFYQHEPSLLERTVIIDGISKSLASTGLRLGYALGKKELIKAAARFQGQTTSGGSALIQRALVHYDFNFIPTYLEKTKSDLRKNAKCLGEAFKEGGQPHLWYQPTSAFYYFIDFSQTPVLRKYLQKEERQDYSLALCEDLLENHGVALVPGHVFGLPNSARMSLVLGPKRFEEAVERLMNFITG